jgi:glycosyltransferase involved in cell wall biosynthesis
VHVLGGVDPAAVVSWVAGADVAVMAIQPSTLNHVLSTPNKLFEAIAAGTPVVASDFPEIRKIVAADGRGSLGELCDPADPRSVAAAIRAIIGLTGAEREALRQRCLAAAHDRWNWETEASALVKLYDDLAGAEDASGGRSD